MRLLYVVVLIAGLKYAESACYNGTTVACNTCGGSCETGGCYCLTDPLQECVPTEAGNCASESNSCCPSGYFYDKNNTCCTDTPICNPSCSADEICANGTQCVCKQLLKGKAIKDLIPSVQCHADAMVVSLHRCLLTYLKYDYSTLRLDGNSVTCNTTYPTDDNGTKVDNIEAKLTSGWCGNIITNDSEKIYITNTIHINILPSLLITVNPLSFNFTCAYNRTMQLNLNYSLHPVIGTASLPGINGTGLFDLTMAAYWDAQYANAIQETETVTVGSDFFLGLFVRNVDGNLLALRVENCVASPTSNRDSSSVSLVKAGCSAGGDINTAVEENGVSLEARIRVSAFKFQSTDYVYIFCDVRLCDRSTNCTTCDSSTKGRSASDTRAVMLQLPYDGYDYSSSVTHSALPWTVLCSALIGFLSVKMY
ncbi:hypothetical protein GDO81_006094 [Engystomops pustulosus]|uniref:ZP domain-containing protein n=1 Tax=Engystomops pustulosus TaxID=76066 RepID=A0AAV7CVL5_ENGPU|nr:hypothetical protein GDO81_006094 [Engystomops pustulosus]